MRSLSVQPAEAAAPLTQSHADCHAITRAYSDTTRITETSVLPDIPGLPSVKVDLSPLVGYTQTSVDCSTSNTDVVLVGFGYSKDVKADQPASVYLAVVAAGTDPSYLRLSREHRDVTDVQLDAEGVARTSTGDVYEPDYSFATSSNIVVLSADQDAEAILANLDLKR